MNSIFNKKEYHAIDAAIVYWCCDCKTNIDNCHGCLYDTIKHKIDEIFNELKKI